MNVFTRAAVLALSFSFSASAVQALSLAEGAQPAEYPPTSYTAGTYVDSRGCVYIRAGYGGNVTWVPQVTREREVVCGARPSLAASAPAASVAAAEPETAPQPAPTPSRAPAPSVVAAPATVPAPRPAPATSAISRTVTLTCPVGGANKQVRSDGAIVILRCEAGQVGTTSYVVRYSTGERIRVIVKPPAPAPAPVQVAGLRVPAGVSVTISDETTGTVRHMGAGNACPDRSGVSAEYTGTSGVRCGPQAIPAVPGSASRVGTSSTPVVVSPTATTQNVAPPPGYRVAWEDDRLNPNRGPRSNVGNAQMDLIWSQTVPRELYDISTGRNVTALFPGLRYPNMPSASQIRAASGS